MANDNKCPIWRTPARTWTNQRDGTFADSPRAGGRYFISKTAEVNLRQAEDAVKAHLTTWLVDQRRLGVECPEIMSTIIDEAERRQPLTVHERADRLLGHLQTRLPVIGDTIKVPPSERDDAMLAWAESVRMSEVTYLLDYLEKSQWIERSSPQSPDGSREYSITPSGYAYLVELKTKAVDSRRAFVAMWFDGAMDDAYEKGIAPGIEDVGYKPIRIDRKDHNNKIDDEIIAEIRRSRFLVADFTQGEIGARGGVYYEAGFAHGLNIPVIFTCRADDIDRVHFDTRQYNHITWTTPEELRVRLAQRIAATIGDGPLKKNSY
jgi:hypothetical protein